MNKNAEVSGPALAPRPDPASTLRGTVTGVPSGTRLQDAVVRFFELDADRLQREMTAERILEAGIPIGSAVTDTNGEFAVHYPVPKRDVAIAFVVEGPDLGESCEIVSWSSRPRRIGPAGESFVIGVNERTLARRRLARQDEDVARVLKNDARRKAGLERPKAIPAKDRMDGLRLFGPPASTDRELFVPDDATADEIRKKNGLLIAKSYRERAKNLERTGARVLPVDTSVTNTAPAGQSRLSSPSENRFFSINQVVDRLEGRLRLAAAVAAVDARKGASEGPEYAPPRPGSAGRRPPRTGRS